MAQKKAVCSHANVAFRACEVFILCFGKFITQTQPIDLHKKFISKCFSIDKENGAGPMPSTVIVMNPVALMAHPLKSGLCQWSANSLWDL